MEDVINLETLQSEGRNTRSVDIDAVPTVELCRIINDEDKTVAGAVTACLPTIAEAIDALAQSVQRGGRVVYVGAGTSGRLGVLDASELPPTFSARPEQFVALIAGGDNALRHAQEGAEDDIKQALLDMQGIGLNGQDALIGIAASGRTPYVLSCLRYAKSVDCRTVGVACSAPSALRKSGDVDFVVEAVTGAEVVTGSTRMKAGTATKMILNMLSTGIQIKLGKTFGNMMVDVKATNLKLKQRARNIIRELCPSQQHLLDQELDSLLVECGGSVKLAIAALRLQTSVPEARQRLDDLRGILSRLRKEHEDVSLPAVEDPSGLKYVLCVDGGGSKCAAFVLASNGEVSSADAVGCNVTTTDANTAVASIETAIRGAVDACASLRGRTIKCIPFAKVWIGLAGFDRPQVAAEVIPRVQALFGGRTTAKLTVTNDLELLAASAGQSDGRDVCVLVAGTGSIAMAFKKGSERYEQVGRAGGWGPLLGDDGSGFDIGRQAIRLLLEAQDRGRWTAERGNPVNGVDTLSEAVLRHLGVSTKAGESRDIVGSLLLPSPSAVGDPKKRIADVARVVIQEQETSETAAAILARSTKSLTDLVHQLTIASGIIPSDATLILTGGMMQDSVHLSRLTKQIAATGLRFGRTDVVLQPGLYGAQHLLSTLSSTGSADSI